MSCRNTVMKLVKPWRFITLRWISKYHREPGRTTKDRARSRVQDFRKYISSKFPQVVWACFFSISFTKSEKTRWRLWVKLKRPLCCHPFIYHVSLCSWIYFWFGYNMSKTLIFACNRQTISYCTTLKTIRGAGAVQTVMSPWKSFWVPRDLLKCLFEHCGCSSTHKSREVNTHDKYSPAHSGYFRGFSLSKRINAHNFSTMEPLYHPLWHHKIANWLRKTWA